MDEPSLSRLFLVTLPVFFAENSVGDLFSDDFLRVVFLPVAADFFALAAAPLFAFFLAKVPS
ncbi:MAG: hypothetical protein ISQ06_07810 [Planctomycetaceae bacterium]|jgi:hypothetical protein|nr:hypothetical protein [Planctomycetaceae bacterium]